jgi:hypothetical protein
MLKACSCSFCLKGNWKPCFYCNFYGCYWLQKCTAHICI